MQELTEGDRLAGYRISEVCGRGAMGIVYRATQIDLERAVALKLIGPWRADAEFRRRFAREAKLAASIEHPNIVPVYEAGEVDGVLYLAMRYVEGTDMRSLLVYEGGLDPAWACSIVGDVAAALDAAHAAGLVHRDVKPANVLLGGLEPGAHVYLTDFGLAKNIDSTSQITGDAGVGTPGYAAPEQLEGRASDSRSDVYALGCVLYESLTGEAPFRRETYAATLLAHLHDPPPKPSASPGVPAGFDTVVSRALAKDPEERFASAGELAAAAVAAKEGGSAPRRSRSRAVRLPRRGSSRRRLAVAGAVGALASFATVAAAAGVFSAEDGPGSESAPAAEADPGLEQPVVHRVDPQSALLTRENPGQSATASQILATVRSFETAYSDQNVVGLAGVLAPDVSFADYRHNEFAGGSARTVGYLRDGWTDVVPSTYRIDRLDVWAGFGARAVWRYEIELRGGSTERGVADGLLARRSGRIVLSDLSLNDADYEYLGGGGGR